MPLIILGALILLPLVFSFVLRVNAGILFLALCAGSVVSQFVGNDTIQIVDSFFPRSNSEITTSVTLIVLLLLPAVMTIIFMRRSMTGTKTLVNLLPAF